MNDEWLTNELAARVMGWKPAPDRFVKAGRGWIPRWRFQPLTRLEDAFQLLETAGSTYSLATASDGTFSARVRVGNRIGRASGEPKATTITIAVARALGLYPSDETAPASKTMGPLRKDEVRQR
jgi:hypothetical protein